MLIWYLFKIISRNFFSMCLKCLCLLSCVWLFATPWTVACQDPLSLEISKQEYWSKLPFPTLVIEPKSLSSLALANGFFTTVPPGKPSHHLISYNPEYLVRVSYLLKHILESVSLRKILITLLYCFYITQSVFRSIANTLINLFESYLIPKYGPFF